MGELDAELGRAVAATMSDDPGKRSFTIVGIKPETAVGNASAPFDTSGFDHEQRGSGITQRAEMVEVPVIRDAVVGAVLAHGRDHDFYWLARDRQAGWARREHWACRRILGNWQKSRKLG